MREPHRIRLRGPWTAMAAESFDESGSRPPDASMQIPCTWRAGGWPGFSGVVVHSRRFGKPRQADADERVWLVVDSIAGKGNVRLNEKVLGPIEEGVPFAFDVTDRLNLRNLLEVEIESPSDLGGITGEVYLEIR